MPLYNTTQVNLQYPLEKQNKYKGRISFQPLQIIPVEDEAVNALNKARIENRFIKSETENDVIPDAEGFISGNIDIASAPRQRAVISESELNEGVKFGLRVRRISEYCRLYVPIGLAFNDNINLSTATLGVSGASALGALGAGGSIISSIIDGATGAGKSLLDTFTGGLTGDAAKVAAARAARSIPGEGLQTAVSIGLQVVANPNQRSVFNSVNLRTFTFAFKFIPLSSRESLEIENIIEWFRKELYPEQIEYGTTNVPFGYKFPNLFDVKIGYDSGFGQGYRPLKNMEILPCYLQSVQHNYNATSMSFHKNGKPTEVDMSLTFVEYRTLSKKDITNPYSTQFDENDEGRIQA